MTCKLESFGYVANFLIIILPATIVQVISVHIGISLKLLTKELNKLGMSWAAQVSYTLAL